VCPKEPVVRHRDPHDHHHDEGRALHLVDLEQLVGPDARPDAIKDVVDAYLEASRWDPDDHVVVAADCGSIGEVAFELDTGWRLLAARGPDGADRAQLHATDPRFAARRYDRLIVGSGAAVFTDLVRSVNRLGGDAWVVARPTTLDHRLRRVASWVVELPDDVTALTA
jgi:hypothetical protein